MKYLSTLIFTFLILIGYSQCDNGTNYYPSFIYTPVEDVWDYASSCNWAGEVIQLNVKAGDTYEFSTCDQYGFTQADYDTQITLLDGLGNLLDFNDDYGGCAGYTSYLRWVAPYSGTVYLHLNEYYCLTNFTCTTVMIYRTPSFALPIELISFTGEILGGDIHPVVMINWEVASQVNNDYYEVQRSIDVETWNTINTVTGAGNNNTQMSYSILDDNPLHGVSYYRLKQTDYDGQTETFFPVSIIISSEEKIIDKVINFVGQEVNENYKGMVLEIYQDGTYVKKNYE
jgi:hypothetical protein